jgi:hypothetical protein
MASKRVVEIVFKAKDQASKSIKKISGGFAEMVAIGSVVGSVATKAFDAIVAGVKDALTFLPDLVKEMAKVGDEFDKMSHRTSLGSDQLSEWAFIVERAGGSAKDFETSVKKLAKSMYDFERGSVTAVEAWEKLGLSPVDAAGNLKDVDTILMELADALPAVTSDVERMAIAQELLGRGGLKMMVAFKDGAGPIHEQIALFKELNGEMSKEFTASAAHFVDAQTDMATSIRGLKADMSEPFMDAAAEAIDALAISIGKLGEFVEDNQTEFEILADVLSKVVVLFTEHGDKLLKNLPLVSQLTKRYDQLKWVMGPLVDGYEKMNQRLDDEAEAYDKLLLPAELHAQNLERQAKAMEHIEAAEAADRIKELADAFGVPMQEMEIIGGNVEMVDRDVEAIKKAIVAAIMKAEKEAEKELAERTERMKLPAPQIEPGSAEEALEQWYEDWNEAQENMPEDMLMDVPVAPWPDDETLAAMEAYQEQMEIIDSATDQMRQGLESVAAASIEAFLSGQTKALMFGRMIRQFAIKAVSDLIAKLLIAKAIKLMMGVPFAQGGQVPMAFGGNVPHAAYGMAVPSGPAGLDSVPIMAMPGEEVINRRLSQRMNSFLASQELATQYSATPVGGGGQGAIHLHMEVGRPVGRLDALDLGDTLVTTAERVQEANL